MGQGGRGGSCDTTDSWRRPTPTQRVLQTLPYLASGITAGKHLAPLHGLQVHDSQCRTLRATLRQRQHPLDWACSKRGNTQRFGAAGDKALHAAVHTVHH